MTSKKGDDLKNRLKQFWRPGDEIICTRIFRWSNNNCYLCSNTPIDWHHVLLNSISNQTIDVEFSCVINMKKILEALGSNQKILFFPKYAEDVNHLNSQYQGTASIIEFSPNLDIIVRMLSRPKEINYKQVRSILDHTVRFNDVSMLELFHAALDIYIERKYYIYEMLDENQKTDNVEQSIEYYFRKEWEMAQYDEEEYKSASYKSHIDDGDCPF